MVDDPAPRTFREVGIVLNYIKSELEDLKDSIEDIKKGQRRLIAAILTSLIFPVISGIILASILGWKQ